MSKWMKRSIQSVCRKVSSGGTPSRKRPEYYESGTHNWVKSQELVDGPIYGTSELITDDALANSSAKLYPPDTVLMAMYGATVGKLGLLRCQSSVNQAICAMITDEDVADYRYLYYALLFQRDALTAKAHGAAQQNLNQGLIKSFELPFPPIETQQRIAGILSAYDDLIKTNTRRIRVLEEMARALYREWFVHYRFPGHEDVAMVEHADLGEVPEGWDVKGFSELAKFVNGFAFKPAHQEGSGLPIVKIPELREGVTSKTPRNSGAEIKPKYHINDGDLLFSWSGSFVVTIWTDGPALLNQHLFRVIDYVPSRKYYLLIALQESIGDFLTLATGATMKHIRRSALSEVKLAVPPGPVRDRFHAILEPIFEQVVCLRQMNENLRQTRDLLLPRLVSGELPIEVAETELAVSV